MLHFRFMMVFFPDLIAAVNELLRTMSNAAIRSEGSSADGNGNGRDLAHGRRESNGGSSAGSPARLTPSASSASVGSEASSVLMAECGIDSAPASAVPPPTPPTPMPPSRQRVQRPRRERDALAPPSQRPRGVSGEPGEAASAAP